MWNDCVVNFFRHLPYLIEMFIQILGQGTYASALILVPRMGDFKCFHSVKKGWMHESLACHSVENFLQRLTPTVGTLHSSWCPN